MMDLSDFHYAQHHQCGPDSGDLGKRPTRGWTNAQKKDWRERIRVSEEEKAEDNGRR